MSEKPLAAAREAAPILKLWLLYLVGSSLQNWSAFCNSVVKNSLTTADPSVCTNNGPGHDPLTAIYSLSRRDWAHSRILAMYKQLAWLEGGAVFEVLHNNFNCFYL